MINKKDYKIIGPFKGWVLQNFPFIEADFDAITSYQLWCKVVEYLNKIGYNEALLEDAVNDITDYLNNLDLQDEVNNKLDEMVESGQLQEIIADYLNSKAIFGFDNVESMKQATNLINGSYAKTLGYYSKNDGGMSTYKIRTLTNEDVVDEASIISLNDPTLIAELITYQVNPIQFGCYGDNIHDDTTNLQKAINYSINKKIPIISEKAKTYKITETIIIDGIIEMDFKNSEINGNFNDDMIKIITSNSSEYDQDKTKYYIFGGYIKNLILNGNNNCTKGLYIELNKKMYINNIEIVNCIIGMEAHSGTETNFDTIRFQGCSIGLKVTGYDMIFNNLFGRFCNIGMQLNNYTQIINSHFWVRPDESEFTNSTYAEVYEGAKIINAQIDSYQTGIKTLGTGGYYLELSGQWQQPMASTETYYLFKFNGASTVRNGFSVRLHDFNAITKTATPYCIFSDIEANQFRGFIDYSTCRCFRISKFPLTTHLELGNISSKLDTPLINRVNIENNMIHIQFFAKVLESFTYLEFAKLPSDGYIETKPLIGIPYQAITTNQYAVNNPVTQFVAGFCSRTKILTLLCLDTNNPVPADSYIYIDFTYLPENSLELSE